MPKAPTLKQRRLQPELMDQPDLSRDQHVQALQGLARINRWSGSTRILWPTIYALAQKSRGRPLRLLDVASGAGDVTIQLWLRAQKAGLPLQIEGCDRSPVAVAYAQHQADEQQASVRFFPLDVLTTTLPSSYDILVSSLFLHHLANDQAGRLLAAMAQAAGQMVLINDLRRCWAGLILATIGTRVLSASRIVHVDGPLSVRAAFTVKEVRWLAMEAGLPGVQVARRWPCRWLLTWRRP